MRLSPRQLQIIHQVLDRELPGAQARLFGSRLDDSIRGGDIDLMVSCPGAIDNPALVSARLASRLEMALDGQAVDVVLDAPNLARLPIHDVAQSEGQLLWQ
jgi:predicted nucleotidyltransferase